MIDFPWPDGRQTKVSFPLRLLIWCGESCSDAFELRSSANFTESLKRVIANFIFPNTKLSIYVSSVRFSQVMIIFAMKLWQTHLIGQLGAN